MIHKTQRRVMLKFLKQHSGKWSESTEYVHCDLCYVEFSKTTTTTVTLARYISKIFKRDSGPYAEGPPILCNTHAQELGLIW